MKEEDPTSPHKENPKEKWSFSKFNDEGEDSPSGPGNSSLPFAARFLLIAVGLIGFLVYLNQTSHVLDLNKNFGQIIYQGIFVLFASAALASGNT